MNGSRATCSLCHLTDNFVQTGGIDNNGQKDVERTHVRNPLAWLVDRVARVAVRKDLCLPAQQTLWGMAGSGSPA